MKKILPVVLSFVLLMSFFLPATVFAIDDTSQPSTSVPTNDGLDNQADAKLYVYGVEKTIVKSGDIIPFPITVGCRSYYDAYNIRIRITGEGEYANSFTIQETTGWYNVGHIQDKETITPTLTVSPNVPNGKYKLTMTFNYLDANDNMFETTDSFFVTVDGRSTDSAYVSSAKFSLSEIGKENKSKLNVSVLNPTTNTLFDVKVTFNTQKTEGFSLYENFLPVSVSDINPGSSKDASFSVYVSSSVTTGNYPLNFDLSYKDGTGQLYTSNQTVYVQVTRSADADGKGSQPRIIVANYKTDVETIQAGKSFHLDFSLQNASNDTAVENIKVVLGSVTTSGTGTNQSTVSNDVFFPSSGSNSFFIEKISPKQSVSESIDLMTNTDVEPGVYAITLTIDYENSSGTTYQTQEQISFPVNQEQRLDIQGLSIPTEGMSGSTVPLTFQYINKGKATIYNFAVAVEGDFTLEGGNTYIGNLTAGYNDYFDSVMVPTGEGELKGAIVLKYEDSKGNEKEDRTEFTMNVMPMDIGTIGGMDDIGSMDPGGMMPPEPEGGNIGTIIIWSVVGLLVAGAVVTAVLIILKKRKAKKVMVDDEED